MKISFTTFACPEWPVDRVLDAADRHGYHGVEFRTDAHHGHGVEVSSLESERREIRLRFDRAGIEPVCLATSLQFVTGRVTDEAPARIKLAADLGCPALRVFCGPPLEGQSHAATIERVGRQLRTVAEIAEPRGVQLWLETHDTLSQGADAGEAVRKARHRLVGVNYNNMHPFRMGEDVEATFASLGPHIRHTHFHDALNLRDTVVIRRLGRGDMPMDAMFEALIKAGYDGYLSGEWFHDQYGETPDESLDAYAQDMRDLAHRHGVRLGSA